MTEPKPSHCCSVRDFAHLNLTPSCRIYFSNMNISLVIAAVILPVIMFLVVFTPATVMQLFWPNQTVTKDSHSLQNVGSTGLESRMQSFLMRSSSASHYKPVDSANEFVVGTRFTSASREYSANEALASLSLAKEMLAKGKTERATKIFTHTLALYPEHPDVLNEYGEFLEHRHSDLLSAEHLYSRALVLSPSHSRALNNYQRTAPLVTELDRLNFLRIDQKRDTLLRVPEGHPGLRRMIEENYYRHLYHSTAIEGNTFTLAQTRSFVETRIVIAGKSIVEHNEILGMEAAMSFLNSSLIKRIGRITVEDILEIQRRVLGYVDPFGAGVFRTTQVFVADYVPPDASRVEHLVTEFIDWLNSERALRLHAVEMAALAHYRLVHIHPFYDGNGRTSRLLMNLILMQAGYPPIIVPVERRQEYYEHLKTANDGDVRPFVRFIARCTERTIDEYLWASVENMNRTFPELSTGFGAGRTIELTDDAGRTIESSDEFS